MKRMVLLYVIVGMGVVCDGCRDTVPCCYTFLSLALWWFHLVSVSGMMLDDLEHNLSRVLVVFYSYELRMAISYVLVDLWSYFLL